jgi:hypothetical protein
VLPFTTDTLVVVHAGTVLDPYNNVTRDWAGATRTTVRGVVQGESSLEATDGRDQTVTTYRCFLPAGTAVTAQDRLEWNGLVLEVDGDPFSWKAPGSALDHVEVVGKVVAG